MLRFFSKIRYKLATENKIGKYLQYAIGEIMLVVIGILIALQVNNWNANRKNNAEFKNTMEALQQDLYYNIYNANLVINNAYKRDSIVTLILNDNITREMYRNNPDIRYVIHTIRYYTPVQDNLLTAINFENRVSNAYKPLIPKLKLLKTYFERWDYTYLGSIQNIGIYEKWLAENFFWYSQNDSVAIENRIDFLLNNPIYKNKAFLFRKGYLHNTVHNTMFIRNHSAGILANLIQLEKNNPNFDLYTFFQNLGLNPYKQVTNAGAEKKSKIQFRTRTLWYNTTNKSIDIYEINKDLQRDYRGTLNPGEFSTPGLREGQYVEVVFENKESQFFQAVVDGFLLIE